MKLIQVKLPKLQKLIQILVTPKIKITFLGNILNRSIIQCLRYPREGNNSVHDSRNGKSWGFISKISSFINCVRVAS